jgi:lipocalin-like protein
LHWSGLPVNWKLLLAAGVLSGRSRPAAQHTSNLVPGGRMNDRHARDALVGTWRLVSWENRGAGGQFTYPMGANPLGYLLYTPDGHFSVTISRASRAGFRLGDLLGGTVEDKARAVESFVAYAGRYTFNGDRVVHHVELSLFPNWVGTEQERAAELTEDRLTLSAGPLLLAGERQIARLVWERVDPSAGGD